MNEQLTLQQQRFCDEYLVSFNAYDAALKAGYSANTARKCELLHLPKVQAYLQAGMKHTSERLEITHDMILRELAKVAFANMGDYYDENAVLKPMNTLTPDQKAAISHYQLLDAVGDYGERAGELSKIKLHNKMSALDKIAKHTGFYLVGKKKDGSGSRLVASPESGVFSTESELEGNDSVALQTLSQVKHSLQTSAMDESGVFNTESELEGRDSVALQTLNQVKHSLQTSAMDESGVFNMESELEGNDSVALQTLSQVKHSLQTSAMDEKSESSSSGSSSPELGVFSPESVAESESRGAGSPEVFLETSENSGDSRSSTSSNTISSDDSTGLADNR